MSPVGPGQSVAVTSNGISFDVELTTPELSSYLSRYRVANPGASTVNMDLDLSLEFRPSKAGLQLLQQCSKEEASFLDGLSIIDLLELCKSAKVFGSKCMYERIAQALSNHQEFDVMQAYETFMNSNDFYALPAVFLVSDDNEYLFGVSHLKRLFEQAIISNNIDIARAIRYSSVEEYFHDSLYCPLAFVFGDVEVLGLTHCISFLSTSVHDLIASHGNSRLLATLPSKDRSSLRMAAISSGDIESVQLVSGPFQVYNTDSLLLASTREILEFAIPDKLILKSNNLGTTLLLNACKKGWNGVVEYLVQFVDIPRDLLYSYIQQNDRDIVRILLDSKKVDVNYAPESSLSPLSLCIFHSRIIIAKWLVLEDSIDMSRLTVLEQEFLNDLIYPNGESPGDLTAILRPSGTYQDLSGLSLQDNSNSGQHETRPSRYKVKVAQLLLDSEYFVNSFRANMHESNSMVFSLGAFHPDTLHIYMELLQHPLASPMYSDLFNEIVPMFLYFHSNVLARFIVRELRSSPDFHRDPLPVFISVLDIAIVVPLLTEALGTFETGQVLKNAIIKGENTLVKLLLDYGVDPSLPVVYPTATDDYSALGLPDMTMPIHFAILHQQYNVLVTLLEHKNTNPDLLALHLAVFMNQEKYIELLLSQREWLAKVPADRRAKVLGDAISIGNTQVIRLLIESSDTSCTCLIAMGRPQSPFYFAQDASTVELLLSIPQCREEDNLHRGIAQPHFSRQVLEHLCDEGYDEAVRRLIHSDLYVPGLVKAFGEENRFALTHPRVLQVFMDFGCEYTDATLRYVLSTGIYSDLNSVRLLVESGIPLDIPEVEREQVKSIMRKFNKDYDLPNNSNAV